MKKLKITLVGWIETVIKTVRVFLGGHYLTLDRQPNKTDNRIRRGPPNSTHRQNGGQLAYPFQNCYNHFSTDGK
jgi:hypothetical protein